jgi:succinate dehydrogenase / fumarate reductase flavoprotein subunit
MQTLVGIFRDEEDLNKALAELARLRQRAAAVKVEGSRMFNPGWHLARDLASMLIVAEAVTRSALARRESRGAHSRIDFPNYNEAWSRQNNIITRDGAAMRLAQRPVAPMPADLREIVESEEPVAAKSGG